MKKKDKKKRYGKRATEDQILALMLGASLLYLGSIIFIGLSFALFLALDYMPEELLLGIVPLNGLICFTVLAVSLTLFIFAARAVMRLGLEHIGDKESKSKRSNTCPKKCPLRQEESNHEEK